MKKNFVIFLLILVFCVPAFADGIAKYFGNKTGCFILYDLNTDKTVVRYNSERCSTRIAPDSTFKIALSLMAFDQKDINENTVFKWDGKKREYAAWNHNQTPHTWLRDSVVWVSQTITPMLGQRAIEIYLKKFNYGNGDFSGDTGKNNALTQAWLHSSLKISAGEQLVFLKRLVTNELPVSKEALVLTKKNMLLEASANGWQLYGKTGSDYQEQTIGTTIYSENGWFIGFTKKDKQTYLFVLNFSDSSAKKPVVLPGIRAKDMAEQILKHENVL